MARRKPGLGRGLDALLSQKTNKNLLSEPGHGKSGDAIDNETGERLKQVPVEQISRGKYQPRRHIAQDALEELANSIRAQGVVQPVVLRPIDGGYELIAGERRWRAAQLAELHEIPAVIKEIPDDAAAAMALIENIQREDLNPLEESTALQRLIQDFDLTHQQAADAVGRSRAAVSNLLRLLELEPETKNMVDSGLLEMGHARALLALSGRQQVEVAGLVVEKAFSVRETERYIKKLAANIVQTKKSNRRSPDVVRLENELSDKIGAPVLIDYDNRGKGKLTIKYSSLDELDGILVHLK